MKSLLETTIENKVKNKTAAAVFAKIMLHGLSFSEWFFSVVHIPIYSYEKAVVLLNTFSTKPVNKSVAKNTENDPKIDLSIVVPVYNGEKYIKMCVDSLISQKTQYTLQIIIVDDGSIDSTSSILKQYSKDARVKVVAQSNKGFSGARNTGINLAQGRYIMFVDADDYVLDNSIEKLLNVAISKNADIVQGEYYKVNVDGEYISRTRTAFNKGLVEPQICSSYLLPGYPWAKVYKKSLFDVVRFPENFWFEDSIINNIIYPLATTIYTINDTVYAYRINTNGITQTFKGKAKSIDTVWILEEIYKYVKENNIKIDRRWIEDLSDQIIVGCYERLHDLPIRLQKASYRIICDVFEKFIKLCSDEINIHNRRVNAIVSRNFYLWKVVCLQNRWGIK